jgi:adenosylcobinamide kinase/adenosylcobinamide-phosphate guanylyltransferase
MRVTLVLGGARSGKSAFALRRAEERFRAPLLVATAEACDAEMARRIEAHRRARSARWACVEEPLAIAGVLTAPPATCDGILVDCLTVWLGNLFVRQGEAAVEWCVQELLEALASPPRDVILVSNEVGLGIVPDHELGRKFRDAAGWLNQKLAARAEEVVFLAAGLPLPLKGGTP